MKFMKDGTLIRWFVEAQKDAFSFWFSENQCIETGKHNKKVHVYSIENCIMSNL